MASVHRPLGRVDRLFLILDLDRLIVPAPETFPQSLITFRGFAGLAPPGFVVVVGIVLLSSRLLLQRCTSRLHHKRPEHVIPRGGLIFVPEMFTMTERGSRRGAVSAGDRLAAAVRLFDAPSLTSRARAPSRPWPRSSSSVPTRYRRSTERERARARGKGRMALSRVERWTSAADRQTRPGPRNCCPLALSRSHPTRSSSLTRTLAASFALTIRRTYALSLSLSPVSSLRCEQSLNLPLSW